MENSESWKVLIRCQPLRLLTQQGDRLPLREADYLDETRNS
jgi:hypothetical protein